MPEPPDLHGMFLGEHVWSPAAKYFRRPQYAGSEWSQPRDCPVKLAAGSLHYSHEASNFDCSTEEGFTLRLPSRSLVEGMELSWSGSAADFVARDGTLVAYDPAVDAEGPSALASES